MKKINETIIKRMELKGIKFNNIIVLSSILNVVILILFMVFKTKSSVWYYIFFTLIILETYILTVYQNYSGKNKMKRGDTKVESKRKKQTYYDKSPLIIKKKKIVLVTISILATMFTYFYLFFQNLFAKKISSGSDILKWIILLQFMMQMIINYWNFMSLKYVKKNFDDLFMISIKWYKITVISYFISTIFDSIVIIMLVIYNFDFIHIYKTIAFIKLVMPIQGLIATIAIYLNVIFVWYYTYSIFKRRK